MRRLSIVRDRAKNRCLDALTTSSGLSSHVWDRAWLVARSRVRYRVYAASDHIFVSLGRRLAVLP